MSTPDASIIICVYNNGETVRACLESLLGQQGTDFEIVIVDDASTDATPQYLESFCNAHSERPITVARNEFNLGVSGARNVGLQAAHGDIVAFTDSDCVADEGWLAALSDRLRKGDVQFVGGAVESPPPRNLAERAYVGTSRIGRTGWQNRSMVGCNMAFVRDVALRYRFDESLEYGCDEDDLTWRLRQTGYRGAFVPQARVMHHHHLTLRSYLRQAWRQGRGAARFWYKRGIYVGRDLVFGFLALMALPLGLLDVKLLIVAAVFCLLQCAAIAVNELFLKGKGIIEAIMVFPVCVLYQLTKGASVAWTWVGMLIGREKRIRDSKRRWREAREEAVGA